MSMQNIALPKKVEIVPGEKPNQSKIIIEPCFPGYGITLGNSLRRVLLSSLPGSAPVGVKIKGANHEFTTVEHLKEDVLEFVLNLKKLRVKALNDDPIKLELEVFGEKEIKASDIKKNSAAEIVNPDLVLGQINDMAGSLQMEIFIGRGMGYETIESRESSEHEIGYIEMDAIYSPIYSVGIKVEYVRVGKMTNWDKLVLDVTTDGTLTPEEAFKASVEILISQFKAIEAGGETAADEAGQSEDGVENKEAIEAEKTETVSTDDESAEPEEDDSEDDDAPKKKRGRPKKA